MVEKSNFSWLNLLVSQRRGLVEAELLPYFEPLDLARFSGVSRIFREMFTFGNAHCVNFWNLTPVVCQAELDEDM